MCNAVALMRDTDGNAGNAGVQRRVTVGNAGKRSADIDFFIDIEKSRYRLAMF